MGTELLHADGQAYRRTDENTDSQTDTTKLIVPFRNFSNAPKNSRTLCHLEGSCVAVCDCFSVRSEEAMQ
jgi:hypothetical protein